MNHSTKIDRIKVVIDWVKGIRMDIPYSKWVMFSIGIYVLSAAIAKVTPTISMIIEFIK